MHTLPPWLGDLEEEELLFMKKFILASGSLKEMAGQYNVTYPTVRLRLDRLIQKIQLKEKGEQDPYVNMIRQFVTDEKMSLETAKTLIAQYRKQVNGF
ncbi:MAG: DUF2089 family protein [Eubacteriales bacterium]